MNTTDRAQGKRKGFPRKQAEPSKMYRFIIADRAWKESSVANNLAYPRIKKYNKLYLFKKIGKNSRSFRMSGTGL